MRNLQVELTYWIDIVENVESGYEKQVKSNLVVNCCIIILYAKPPVPTLSCLLLPSPVFTDSPPQSPTVSYPSL